MYYVYILHRSDNKLYVGSTKNIRQRLKYHKTGKVKSTKPYLPVRLIYLEFYLSKRDAQARERYLKTGDGRQELKKQLKHILMARSSNG